jgi:hypothetical protein
VCPSRKIYTELFPWILTTVLQSTPGLFLSRIILISEGFPCFPEKAVLILIRNYTFYFMCKIWVLTLVLLKIQVFWDKIPFWLVNSYWHFKVPYCLHPQDVCNPRRVTAEKLKMKAKNSSKLVITFYQSKRYHIPHDFKSWTLLHTSQVRTTRSVITYKCRKLKNVMGWPSTPQNSHHTWPLIQKWCYFKN